MLVIYNPHAKSAREEAEISGEVSAILQRAWVCWDTAGVRSEDRDATDAMTPQVSGTKEKKRGGDRVGWRGE